MEVSNLYQDTQQLDKWDGFRVALVAKPIRRAYLHQYMQRQEKIGR